MQFKKAAIILTIVPAMFITGCEQSQQDVAVQKAAETANALNESYAEAKKNGYTGTFEEWVKLVELNQTNPQQAQQQAKDSGFDGMDMLMAGAMGMMLGNMMSNGSMSSYRNSGYYDRDRRGYASGGSGYVAQKHSYSSSNVTSRANAAKSSSSVSRGGFGGATSSGG